MADPGVSSDTLLAILASAPAVAVLSTLTQWLIRRFTQKHK